MGMAQLSCLTKSNRGLNIRLVRHHHINAGKRQAALPSRKALFHIITLSDGTPWFLTTIKFNLKLWRA